LRPTPARKPRIECCCHPIAAPSRWGPALRFCLWHRDLLRFSGVSRRHRRSPTSAIKPAGQDPKARLGAWNAVSTALFTREGQSFLDNLIAGWGPIASILSRLLLIR
jgi:hypothetical protein